MPISTKILSQACSGGVPEIDFQTASEANLEGVDDKDVLALCAREEPILVTHDRRTMPHHFAEFIATGTSPGVFIVQRSTELVVAIEALILVWTASDVEEYVNSIRTLSL
ncbi:MAG TPA: DUF5615 family PIN-like protein [Pyrinomonadaceae bacterium]|jgi:hypothetical protein